MQCKHKAGGMSHILDDFFFIGPAGSDSCKNDLTNFLFLCKKNLDTHKNGKNKTPHF